MEYHNFGGGVVSFDNVIDIDQEFLKQYILWLREDTESTKSRFNLPERFMDILGKSTNRTPTKEQKDFIQSCEDGVYKCLVQYCALYSEAAVTVWWRDGGHIAGYSEGRHIGPHCDNEILFKFDEIPKNEFPIHNTVSSALYFNDCVETKDELNGNNFTGGHIKFKYAGVDYAPKAGSAILYPSNYMGTHEVTPVIDGSRYVYLEFFNYGIPKNQDGSFNDGSGLSWLPDLNNDHMHLYHSQAYKHSLEA